MKHNAKGLCKSCFSSEHRRKNLKRSQENEATRRVKPENRAKQKEAHAKWYREHAEEHIANTTQYRKEHPEQSRKHWAKYRANNREACNVACRKHWHANKEAESEKRRQWRKSNKEKVRISNNRRRALKENAEGSFTLEEWLACIASYNHQCYGCLCVFDEENIPTVDHSTPLSRGGSNYIDNIEPLCGKCNSKKGTKTKEEFLTKINSS